MNDFNIYFWAKINFEWEWYLIQYFWIWFQNNCSKLVLNFKITILVPKYFSKIGTKSEKIEFSSINLDKRLVLNIKISNLVPKPIKNNGTKNGNIKYSTKCHNLIHFLVSQSTKKGAVAKLISSLQQLHVLYLFP